MSSKNYSQIAKTARRFNRAVIVPVTSAVANGKYTISEDIFFAYFTSFNIGKELVNQRIAIAERFSKSYEIVLVI